LINQLNIDIKAGKKIKKREKKAYERAGNNS